MFKRKGPSPTSRRLCKTSMGGLETPRAGEYGRLWENVVLVSKSENEIPRPDFSVEACLSAYQEDFLFAQKTKQVAFSP